MTVLPELTCGEIGSKDKLLGYCAYANIIVNEVKNANDNNIIKHDGLNYFLTIA